MANNHSLLTFLAGAAAGAALTAFLKADREKFNAVLDKVEEMLGGKAGEAAPEAPAPEEAVTGTETAEEEPKQEGQE